MSAVEPQTPTGAPPATGHALGRTDMHPASGYRGPTPSSVTGYGPNADAVRAEVDADNAKDREIRRLQVQLANTQGHRERLVREAATMTRELNRLTAELATCRNERDRLGTVLDEIAASSDIHGELAREALEAKP